MSQMAPLLQEAELRNNEDEIDLAQLTDLLWGYKWTIAGFVVVALVLAAIYLVITKPVYKTDALLQIQPGSESPLQGLDPELAKLTGRNTSPAASEIPIIQSRSVLGKTVKDLNLTIHAAPKYFPVIGWAIASRRPAQAYAQKAVEPESGWFGGGYAWMSTEIKVDRFDVPTELEGKAFDLVALGGGRYQLIGPEGKTLLTGQVGHPARGTAAEGGSVGLFVSRLAVARPPVTFSLTKKSWLKTVEGLQDRLTVSEKGQDTGAVGITLEGTRKVHIAEIVNSIAQNYIRQNVEAKSQKAQKSLEFLNSQLPDLENKVKTAESALARYREQHYDAIDLSATGQSLLDQSVALEDKLSQAKIKIAELKQYYMSDYPPLQAAEEQTAELREQRQEIEKQIGNLPASQKKIIGLQRDLQVNTQLYTFLLNRAQQLRVAKAGTVGNARIVDPAVSPVKAVSPRRSLVLALALVLGLVLGCGYVFLRAALRRGVSDPKVLENNLGYPVYAIVPFSEWQQRAYQRALRRHQPLPLIARDRGDDMPVEALRGLRTSLYFAQMESGNNIILVTGASPSIGKSFVCTNLAYLLGDTDSSVLLVDADMRMGHLHRYTEDQKRAPGLSDILSRQIGWRQAIKSLNDNKRVRLLTTGKIPPNPSELLMRQEFSALMEELRKEYDWVIIDAPPILAATDAAVIAASLPGLITFMVALAGHSTEQELAHAAERLKQSHSSISGFILNAYKKEHGAEAGSYSYYSYYQYGHKA